jgi:hypothetical protein
MPRSHLAQLIDAINRAAAGGSFVDPATIAPLAREPDPELGSGPRCRCRHAHRSLIDRTIGPEDPERFGALRAEERDVGSTTEDT